MKMRYVSSKSISLTILLLVAGGLSACGGHFNAHSKLSAPMVTSDPLAGAKGRLQEGAANGETEINLFDSPKNEEGFNKSMNGEEFDLQKHAEYLETHPDEADAKTAPSYKDEDPDEEANDPREVVPEAAPSVKAGGPSAKEEPAKVDVPKAEKSEPEKDVTAEPAAQSSTPTPTPKPRPRFKAIAVPTFARDICETMNIKSSKTENFDHLYEDKSPLPSNLPAAELKQMQSRDKQNQFVCLLLPHALRMNAVVFNQRVYVARMQYRHSKGIMKDADKEWVSQMKTAYGLKDQASFEDLLKRVDVVPLPMLLTQAAVESGWGTSKAVREVRNLFGIHGKVGDPNCKLGYEKDGKSCLVVFRTVTESVAYYIRLLNRHKAYEAFRTIRAAMRTKGQPLDSAKLMTGLQRYSERGQAYIDNLKLIMSGHNKLDKIELNETKMAESAARATGGSSTSSVGGQAPAIQ